MWLNLLKSFLFISFLCISFDAYAEIKIDGVGMGVDDASIQLTEDVVKKKNTSGKNHNSKLKESRDDLSDEYQSSTELSEPIFEESNTASLSQINMAHNQLIEFSPIKTQITHKSNENNKIQITYDLNLAKKVAYILLAILFMSFLINYLLNFVLIKFYQFKIKHKMQKPL